MRWTQSTLNRRLLDREPAVRVSQLIYLEKLDRSTRLNTRSMTVILSNGDFTKFIIPDSPVPTAVVVAIELGFGVKNSSGPE